MAICHDKLDSPPLLSLHDVNKQLVVEHHILPIGDRARGWTASNIAVPNPTDLVHILCSFVLYADRSARSGTVREGLDD